MGFVKSQKFTRVATFPSCIIICQTRLMFLTTRKLVRWLRPRPSDGKCHIRFIHWAPDHNGRKVWDTLKDVYLHISALAQSPLAWGIFGDTRSHDPVAEPPSASVLAPVEPRYGAERLLDFGPGMFFFWTSQIPMITKINQIEHNVGASTEHG